MSEEAIAHNYAGQMEALGLAIDAVAADIGSTIAPLDNAAAALGNMSTQAKTAKEAVTEDIGKIRTAGDQFDEAGAALDTNTIISPNHPKMQAALGAGGEALSALETAKEQYGTAEATLEEEAGKFGERKTLIEADSAVLKEFVRKGEAFSTEVTQAAANARPAW